MVRSRLMRARRRSPSPRRDSPATRSIWGEALAIVVMAVAVLLVLSLVSHQASDPVPWPLGHGSDQPVGNVAGAVGAFLSELLYQILGYAAWAAPLLLLLAGWRIFWGRGERFLSHAAGSAVIVAAAAACLDLVSGSGDAPPTERAGGWIGATVGRMLSRPFNRWGGLVVAVALVGTGLLLVGRASFVHGMRALATRAAGLARNLWLAMLRRREARRKEKLRLEVAARQRERQARAAAAAKDDAEPHVEPHAELPIPLAVEAGPEP